MIGFDIQLLGKNNADSENADTVNNNSNITAFYIHDGVPGKEATVALDSMRASGKWAVVVLPVDHDIAVAFRICKLPSLVIYNSKNEETTRVFGDQSIVDMINKVLD